VNSVVLTSYKPNRLNGGAPLRDWQNIRALAHLGPVDVVTVGVDDPPEVVAGIREWVPFSIRHRSALDQWKTRCWPLRPGVHRMVDQYHSQAVVAWLRARLRRGAYDVALVEGISMASYITDLKRAGCRVIFDAHNVESVLLSDVVQARDQSAPAVRRAKNWVVRRRIRAIERRAVRSADMVWACSSTDARLLARIYGMRGIAIVPNGVDVDAYRRPTAAPIDDDWTAHPITVVYSGLFSYSPNEQAALSLINAVLPAIRARGRDARVVLVGRGPTPRLLAAAASDDRVIVTGAVDSVLPHLEQRCVVALPITLGSGTRLKIVEAFAVGRPVVSTAKGAEGLEACDGRHVLIREDAASMADAVIALWSSPPLRTELCRNALELVRTGYSWPAAAKRIADSLTFQSQSVPQTWSPLHEA
jgi:glycosyltransferase involved in cell wall biosynthesis